MVRKFVLGLTLSGVLVFAGGAAAFADDPHSAGATGQPGQSCQLTTVTPGNATNAPGSAFNTSGVAGTHYAGNVPQSSNNPNSVSQYDVACFQQTSR